MKLDVIIEVAGKCLEIPCYVIDSAKPVWQGNVKNCGMIIGTNTLVDFHFCISHFNGEKISPVSLPKQELSAKVSKQTYLPLTDTINSIPVQVDLAVQETLLQNIRTQQSQDKEIIDVINYLEKKILRTYKCQRCTTYCCNSKERILYTRWNIVL